MTSDRLAATLAALDADWADVQVRHPERRPAERLAEVAGDPDAALWVLLAEHAAGDPVAGQVVLRAMLGKLVRLAACDPVARLDDYLAAAWERIATYPLARRHRVAANLALDTLKAVKREQRSGRACVAVDPGPGMGADAVLAVAAQLGLLEEGARRVLEAVYVEGCSGPDAARRLGTTPGAVRVRCHRAVARLRDNREELMLAMAG